MKWCRFWNTTIISHRQGIRYGKDGGKTTHSTAAAIDRAVRCNHQQDQGHILSVGSPLSVTTAVAAAVYKKSVSFVNLLSLAIVGFIGIGTHFDY